MGFSPIRESMNNLREGHDGTTGARGLILVANDHEWTARSVETILVASGYDVVRTFTGAETLAVASRRMPEVFILDHQLPDISGLAVCAEIRADPRFGPSVPVIITTAGPSGRSQRMAAHEAGAWEFYGQPLDGEALLHKVRVFSEARREVLRVAREGLIDPQTGLYNRTGLVRRTSELVAEARRTGGAVACVAVAACPDSATPELDLQLVSAVQQVSRAADARGRLSPSAFAVVVGGDPVAGERVADRLRRAVGGTGKLRIVVTTSDAGSLLSLEGDTLLDRATTELAAA
jgi:CheY-like chemotaxis protein